MAYNSRSGFKSSAAAAFVPGSVKWAGSAELGLFNTLVDSAAWESQKSTMGSATYHCNAGNLQEYTMTGSATLVITNAEAGKSYTLIKHGAFSLTLPTGQKTASTNVVPPGDALVNFLFDGTTYWFNFTMYSGT